MGKLFCEECGIELSPAASFCGKCGAKIKQLKSPLKPSFTSQKKKKQKSKGSFRLILPIVIIIGIVGCLIPFIFPDSLPVTAMSYSADNNRLMSVGDDGYLQIWDATHGKSINRKEIPGDWSTTNALAWAPNNQFIALARTYPKKDNEIQIFDSNDLIKTSNISSGSDLIGALCIDPNGNTLYSVTHRLGIGVWDIEKGERLNELNDLPRRYVSHVMFDKDCQRIATIEGTTNQNDSYETTEKKLVVYQRINMESLLEVPFNEDSSEHPDWVGISPDGKSVTTIKRNEKRIKTTNIDTGKTTEISLTNVSDPRSLAMGANNHMAIAGWDGLIKIYDSEGILLQTLRPGSSIGAALQAFFD